MSRPLPGSIRPVLGYLVGLLGSDRDAEALGAARAIERKLVAAGLDFHDLAAVVAGTAPAVRDITPSPAAPARPRSRRAEMWKPPVHVHLDQEQRSTLLLTLAKAIDDDRLGRWQRHELRALVDRVERGEKPPTRRMLERAEEIVAAMEGATV